ncbi:hypothetical protein BJ165DRAFT_1595854 [Panaeolus papilionaceus]|nr:hypothetical protein BJ165DRAFT_1595854 [Panaeolus papilionaceus]
MSCEGSTTLVHLFHSSACDIPAHNYIYTFEPKADWSSIYAGPTTRAELHADYILKMVDGYQTENIHCIVPKATAIEDYNTHRDDFVKSTLWDDDRLHHNFNRRVTMDGPNHQPLEGPVFPPEIFEAIISILAARPLIVALTEDQKSTLKRCALVSRLAEVGLDDDGEGRLDRLASILKATPSVQRAVQQISISLDAFTWPESSEADLQKRTDALLSLSDVRRREGQERISAADEVGLFCTRLIKSHATKGTLDTLVVKKMSDIPYTMLFACPSLTTLSLDRCHPFPDLTEPIHTIRSLTWRKMDLLVSTLSYFPNLEVLRIIRADIKECSALAIAHMPAPSFQIRTLALEQCARYLGGLGAFTASVTALLQYFYGKGEEKGVKPFDHLTTLSVILSGYAEFSVVTPLLRDVAVSVVNLVQHFRKSNLSISFKYQSMEILDLVTNVNLSTNNDEATVVDHSEIAFLQSWGTFVSSSLFDTQSGSGFMGLSEVEIYLLVDDNPNILKREEDVTDEMVDSLVGGYGIFAATSLGGFDDGGLKHELFSMSRNSYRCAIMRFVPDSLSSEPLWLQGLYLWEARTTIFNAIAVCVQERWMITILPSQRKIHIEQVCYCTGLRHINLNGTRIWLEYVGEAQLRTTGLRTALGKIIPELLWLVTLRDDHSRAF